MNTPTHKRVVFVAVCIACILTTRANGDPPKTNKSVTKPIEKLPIFLSRLQGTRHLSTLSRRHAKLSPDGEWFVCDGVVWNTATGKRVADRSALKGRLRLLYFTRKSRPIFLQSRVKGGATALVGIDAVTGRERFVYPFVPYYTPMTLSSNNALLCIAFPYNSPEQAPVIIDSASGAKISRLDMTGIRLSKRITGLGFTADGRRYYWVDDRTKTVHVWAVNDGRRLVSTSVSKYFGKATVMAVLNRDGSRAVLYSADKRLALIDLKTGRALRSLPGPKNCPGSLIVDRAGSVVQIVHFSPDEKRLVVDDSGDGPRMAGGGSCVFRVFGLSTGKLTFQADPPDADHPEVSDRDAAALSHAWGKPFFWQLTASRGALRQFLSVYGDLRYDDVVRQSKDGRLLVIVRRHAPGAGEARTAWVVEVWETASGKRLVQLFANQRVKPILSGDGRRLVVGAPSGALAVLDVAFQSGSKIKRAPLVKSWKTLRSKDPAAARRAVFRLVAGKEKSVRLLVEQLKPATAPKNIKQLIADLGARKFATRDAAQKALARLGAAAVPELKKALEDKRLRVGARLRIQQLLGSQRPLISDPDLLQRVRAVEVLERIGGNGALKVLERLSTGDPHSPLTVHAIAARRAVIDRERVVRPSPAMRREFAESLRLYWFAGLPVVMPQIPTPIPPAPPGRLITYRFVARIIYNGGVTPFKLGTKITGEFTYDTSAKNVFLHDRNHGRYRSDKNKLTFRYGKLSFASKGAALASVYRSDQEGFSLVASDIELPKGWTVKRSSRRSSHSGMTVSFQNAPRRQVIKDGRLPNYLPLHRFVNERYVELSFNGLSFPAGKVDGVAGVVATIVKLERTRQNNSK